MSGKCFLVGAGPGDIGLVTLRAKQLVEEADVLVYDHLVNSEILSWSKDGCELIYVGKQGDNHTMPQEQINQLIVEKTKLGKTVVRLKGGDPFIFGRGGEEAEELLAKGCEFEVVPGITSAVAAATYAGIPLTHRSYNSTVTFLTGHEDPAKGTSAIDWAALAKLGGTLAIYMGMEQLDKIIARLVAGGMPMDTPVAVIQWGTTGKQRSVRGTAKTIYSLVNQAKISSPAIIVVGQVVKLSDKLNWFEKKPLQGQRIVLTRTRDQASRLKDLLIEQGADVIEMPTIHIVPRVWSGQSPFIRDYQWIVFTSPNAVDAFFDEYLRKGDMRDFASIRFAVVGPATRARLEKKGFSADFIPPHYTAESLVSAWDEEGRVLFPCGNLAEDVIIRGLNLRRCPVTRLEVYRTEPVKEDRAGVRKRLEEEGADWVIFASSSAVENFHSLNLTWEKEKCRFASFGPATSSTMRKLGYSIDLVATSSKIEVMVRELVQLILSEKRPS